VSDDLFRLDGRIAIVTGGAGQLGAEIVRAFEERGARVAVFDAAHDEPVDVTDRAQIERATASVVEKWGEAPHILVNAAALDSPPDAPPEEVGPFEAYPEESFDQVMDVNVKGTFLCCQVVGARMAADGRGSIVNISSVYGMLSPVQDVYEFRRRERDTYYKPVAYSVSKSALYNLTRYLATYWARSGVRVNTLTLSGVFNDQPREFLDAYEARMPIGRMADVGEVVGPVVFLASDASSYVTGSNLVADGGWSAW
jgi:NAD(P)-dependent dehydrogenase (short-subunit alcohol dehydrogenase family)